MNIQTQVDEKEDKDIISNIDYYLQEDFQDYYYRNVNFKWNKNTILH